MRLFIAEKPELAKAIVEGLGGGQRQSGYFECGNDCVTWCFGHMLQLFDPEDYDEKYAKWNMVDLPIAHIPWRKKPSKDKQDQLNTILALMDRADIVVNAGDPDDEGQLLIDEILEYGHCQVSVKRVLINDLNTKVVKKALNNLRDNTEFQGLSAAAEARSVGDQLYGYNLTRAYTLSARGAGFSGVLSVGRVQTPILGLVVRRDRQNESHKKSYYYTVIGQFDFNGASFPARYQIKDTDPVDTKGRLIDADQAQSIVDHVKNKPAKSISTDTHKKEQHPPLPYNLLKLQADASRKFGFKPDQVKEITQNLREKHKLITYNRSDCQYLSDEHHEDAAGVLQAVSETAPLLSKVAERSDTNIKSRAFNTEKVSAHHAIIPTEGTANFNDLRDEEQKIYMLIARAYIAQFWPKHKYDQTTIVVEIEGYQFAIRSNITTSSGWLSLYKNDADNEELQGEEHDLSVDIRTVNKNDKGTCTDASSHKMETKPQPLYTMATLLSDLTRVAKYVKDDRLKKSLIEKDKGKQGEHGGIGTPATRDSIIATLFDRGYLAATGKKIISTQTGKEFYDSLPDQAKYPDMTALWHEQQKLIQNGELDQHSFVNELLEYVSKEITNVKTHGIGIKVKQYTCPKCGRQLRRIKGSDGFFWGCTGFDDGCKFSCPEKGGKPAPKKPPKVSTVHQCKSCGKGLIRKAGKKRGSFWWGCSGHPECKQTYPEIKGKPNYNIGRK